MVIVQTGGSDATSVVDQAAMGTATEFGYNRSTKCGNNNGFRAYTL